MEGKEVMEGRGLIEGERVVLGLIAIHCVILIVSSLHVPIITSLLSLHGLFIIWWLVLVVGILGHGGGCFCVWWQLLLHVGIHSCSLWGIHCHLDSCPDLWAVVFIVWAVMGCHWHWACCGGVAIGMWLLSCVVIQLSVGGLGWIGWIGIRILTN